VSIRMTIGHSTEWVPIGSVDAPSTSLAVFTLDAQTAYSVWVQADLDGHAPEPTGSQASTTTLPVPAAASDSGSNELIAIIVPIVIVIALIMLIVAMFVVRRRHDQRKTTTGLDNVNILELTMSALPSVETKSRSNTIPDSIAIEYYNYPTGTGELDVKQRPLMDPTLINTLPEVSLPGFLRLDYTADLRLDRKLTAGGEGTIWRATVLDRGLVQRNNNKTVAAVKHVTGSAALDDEANLDRFHQEIAIMWSLSFHRNVIKLIGYTDEPRTIVTPLYKTDLFRFLHHQDDEDPLEPGLALHLCAGISSAMDAIHTMGIVHRDIKSANILLNEPEQLSQSSYPHPLLADFGLARSEGEAVSGVVSIAAHGISPRYAAPEVFARMHLRNVHANSSIDDDKRSDVYSLGVTFWEVLSRKVPWSDVSHEQVEMTVRGGGRLAQLDGGGSPQKAIVIAIVDDCLQTSVARRPTAASIHSKLADALHYQ